MTFRRSIGEKLAATGASRPVKPVIRLLLLALSGLVAIPSPGLAQTQAPNLLQLSLEELMNIEITSASRKEQRADEVPAAVFVITQDDIRRSGMRTLPELFRLVPGMQVAQINSSNWAVSIRGFNAQFSNKLLVLIDGRSIYKRNFSGVFWDTEDMMLDDIDRIEVIRGPGGAVWGANAVNGVINIVTKAARDTQGTLVRAGGGPLDGMLATARYGGSFANAAYRVYSQWTDHGDTRLAGGGAAHDNWSTLTTGARLDWTRRSDEFTVHGDVRRGEGRPLWNFMKGPTAGVAPVTDNPASFGNGNLLARWTHRGDQGDTLQVQSFVAISRRSVNVPDNVTDNENTVDTELQYHRRAGARHDVVAGGGYRFIDSTTTSQSFAFSLTPPNIRTAVVNVFAQDEIAFTERLRVTIGAKLERDTASGWGLQPTARVMWQPAPRHHAWFSASRALRTPSNTDRAIRINAAVIPGPGAPVVIGVLGNPEYQTEEFQDAEAGYRVEILSMLSADVTAFRGRYKGLPTNEPLAPVFNTTLGQPYLFVASRFENRLQADTAGLEIAARLAPAPGWRLDASYSNFRLTPHPDANSRDAAAAGFDGNAPSHQWQLHSTVRLGLRTDVNAALYRMGALRSAGVPAYTRADAGVEVRLTGRLSAAVTARNLFDAAHTEYVAGSVVSTQIPRSASINLVWRPGP